ncbi:MAG: hypothetical protein DI620_04285 [Haemophilus parainfluenzae]|nr:MAG: hypothetical protein DI620_04285 [Haemophilus parainfluenzae]
MQIAFLTYKKDLRKPTVKIVYYSASSFFSLGQSALYKYLTIYMLTFFIHLLRLTVQQQKAKMARLIFWYKPG